MRTTAAPFRLALAAAALILFATGCTSEPTDLRPAQAIVEDVPSLTAPISSVDDAGGGLAADPASPTPLTIPGATTAPSEYVLYNETNGFRGTEPGNELVLASFDDGGAMTVWHTWPNMLEAPEGSPAYLTEEGTLLVAGATPGVSPAPNTPIGNWSTLRLLATDGSVLWEHIDCGPARCMHHDVEPLPDGNLLAFVYYRMPADEAARFGLDTVDGIWMDQIVELRPIYGDQAATECGGEPWCTETVWRWDPTDHALVPDAQAVDDRISAPQTIDLRTSDGGVDGADPIHFNGIDYNANLDQIAVSSFSLSEIFIIDHSETGDILYRWGRPSNYGPQGFDSFGHQHDPAWIDDNTLSVMNNNSPFGELLFDVQSEVVTLDLPLTADGTYELVDQRYGPDQSTIIVDRQREPLLNAPFMSGATIRADGSALVTLSLSKELASFDSAGTTEWIQRLPGPGGQMWKAQVLAPASPQIRALTEQAGPLTAARHHCHVDPDRPDCQPTTADPTGESGEAELPGSDRQAPTAQVAGVWLVAVTGPNGTLEQPLQIEQEDDQLVGFLDTFALTGTVQGNVVTLSSTLVTPFGELPASFELVVGDQTMSGVASLSGLPIDLGPQQVTVSR